MFIPPKSDICIKELFHNETVLRYFISAVLAIPPEDIRSIRLKNPFLRRRLCPVKKIKLKESGEIEAWIRFFRAESEEDLDMIKTKNPGILEAIREVKEMSLSCRLRLRYEAHLKQIRDEKAWKTYERAEARKEGLAEGREKGREEGREEGLAEGRRQIIRNMIDQKIPDQEILRLAGCSEEELKKIKGRESNEKNCHRQFFCTLWRKNTAAARNLNFMYNRCVI